MLNVPYVHGDASNGVNLSIHPDNAIHEVPADIGCVFLDREFSHAHLAVAEVASSIGLAALVSDRPLNCGELWNNVRVHDGEYEVTVLGDTWNPIAVPCHERLGISGVHLDVNLG